MQPQTRRRFYTFANLIPPLDIRQAIRNIVPNKRHVPPNANAYLYSPLPFRISTPASGGPVRFAKLMIEYTIPILVPAFLRSTVSEERAAGKRPWTVAPTMPNEREKLLSVGVLWHR